MNTSGIAFKQQEQASTLRSMIAALRWELWLLLGGKRADDALRSLEAVGASIGSYYLATIVKTAILAGEAVCGVRSWEFDSADEATRFKCGADLYIGALRRSAAVVN